MTQLFRTQPPTFESAAAERQHRKERLAGACRVFAMLGYAGGRTGHLTVRDPERPDRFWANPVELPLAHVTASDLVLVAEDGAVVEGEYTPNVSGVAIVTQIHRARPDVNGVAHAHTLHGGAFSALGATLDPINQDACAFFDDCAVLEEFKGLVATPEAAREVAEALGRAKAIVMRHHGLLTVGETIDSAVWWLVLADRACQAQLLAMAAGSPRRIDDETARATHRLVGSELAGWTQFQVLFETAARAQPDFLA